jgi:hypothetical protein
MRALAVLAPLLGMLLGAAMAVQWAVGGGMSLDAGPPGAGTVGRWMADTLPLMDEHGDPVWAWRGPFFVVGLMTLPLVWNVTGSVRSWVARWSCRGGLLVATVAMAVEYNSASGYGWLIDLAGLILAVLGTALCGVSVLRGSTLPLRIGWAMLGVLPLTPVAGLLTFWYLPPGLTMGLLLSWAMVGLLPLRPRAPRPDAIATPTSDGGDDAGSHGGQGRLVRQGTSTMRSNALNVDGPLRTAPAHNRWSRRIGTQSLDAVKARPREPDEYGSSPRQPGQHLSAQAAMSSWA